jgi:hypothetical protein
LTFMKSIAVLLAAVALLAVCAAPVTAKPLETEATEGFVCDGSYLLFPYPPHVASY